MTQKSELRGGPRKQGSAPPTASTKSTKADRNNPVPIEEFDREHMGIAAKE